MGLEKPNSSSMLCDCPVGVQSGSLAAAVHSNIGNVAAGSIFAAFQSAGAGGAALGIMNGAIQGAGAAIFSLAAYAKYYLLSNTTAANNL
ncbi:Hypothetical protein PENO1_103370 [Penicillium occitanis (nom. inval.)]|nr:Hypothetical protein PENO1_103370 [Penicillium occitanis (nom. inval.)]PCG90049.1 hypothetical protein PENOC_103960 [Penicillium occitanis (nom. inval.)]